MEKTTQLTDHSMVQKIVNIYRTFDVTIKAIAITEGPSTILCEVQPIGQTKVAAVIALEEELAVTLAAKSVRIGILPGRGTIGIEITTGKQTMVPFVFDQEQVIDMQLPVYLGQDVTSTDIYKDLTKMTHLLIGGSSGQGKSVFINALIISLLECKQDLKFVMIDPKKVELAVYQDLNPTWFFNDVKNVTVNEPGPITDPILAFEMLNNLCVEMDARYKTLQNIKARNIVEAKAKGLMLPYIVCIIDEFADLIIANKAVELPVIRLAQLGRACGIHLVLATQRPSTAVVTGMIKANFPTRISFKTASNMDSRVILDKSGAEKLCGSGDMLYSSSVDLLRIQGSFISMTEVEELVNKHKQLPVIEKSGHRTPTYCQPQPLQWPQSKTSIETTDTLLQAAKQIVVNSGQGSTSLLQRKLKISYDQAIILIGQLEQAGVVGPFVNGQPRAVLVRM